MNNYGQKIIAYYLRYGNVYGGSGPKRTVTQVIQDSDGKFPGGVFNMELNLNNHSLAMELNGEKIIIDESIGDFQYSPIVMFFEYDASVDPEITLV